MTFDKKGGAKLCRSWISLLGMAIALSWAAAANAQTVTKTYYLTPNSKLVTPIASAEDFFRGTGFTPGWTNDGGSGHVPVTTLNTVTIQFTADAPGGNVIDGPITVTDMDFYHKINSGLENILIVTGQQDNTGLNGATGSLLGTTVESWSVNFSLGEIHNELYCEDLAGAICGALGLPANKTLQVTHLDNQTDMLAVDTTASPDAASLPMTFTNGFESVCFEMTIDQTSGRQYYDVCGSTDTPVVPMSNEMVQLVMIGTMALAGFLLIAARRRTATMES